MNRIKKYLKRFFAALLIAIILLLMPIGYIETFCTADFDKTTKSSKPILPASERRMEANTFLTYPEWHIVYAYEGLAKVLENNDEYAFDYFKSISSFWSTYCSLNKMANRYGGGDFNTRGTIHTIGVSFTLELLLKAAYEETIGRVFAAVRGNTKTSQDVYSGLMAKDYAKFLLQEPWYKYDFDTAINELWAEPIEDFSNGWSRSWERRLALSGEWKAKSGYAGVIASAVSAAGDAKIVIQSVVTNLSNEQLVAIKNVTVVSSAASEIIIQTPRYRDFFNAIVDISNEGGVVKEIAGNDEVMISAIVKADYDLSIFKNGRIVSRMSRDGYDDDRILILIDTSKLNSLVKSSAVLNIQLEHIYDY